MACGDKMTAITVSRVFSSDLQITLCLPEYHDHVGVQRWIWFCPPLITWEHRPPQPIYPEY